MFELVIERSSLTGNEHTNLQCSINLIKQYNYGTYIMKVVYFSLYVVKKRKKKKTESENFNHGEKRRNYSKAI